MKRYNAAVLTVRFTVLLALAILMVAFLTSYPYLGSVGMCDSGECPTVVNSNSGGSSINCCPVVASIAALSVAGVVAVVGRLRGTVTIQSPSQLYLSPEHPPPRLSL
jgi:hypothetical protein